MDIEKKRNEIRKEVTFYVESGVQQYLPAGFIAQSIMEYLHRQGCVLFIGYKGFDDHMMPILEPLIEEQ